MVISNNLPQLLTFSTVIGYAIVALITLARLRWQPTVRSNEFNGVDGIPSVSPLSRFPTDADFRQEKGISKWRRILSSWRYTQSVICPETLHTELFSGGAAAWWTFLLLSTAGESGVSLFSTNPLFHDMAAVMPEISWGIRTLLLAIVGILTAFRLTTPLVRSMALGYSVFLWTFIALCLAKAAPTSIQISALHFSVPMSTGAGLYGALALMSGISLTHFTGWIQIECEDIRRVLSRLVVGGRKTGAEA